MQRFNAFWNSGPVGKIATIAGFLTLAGCLFCGTFLAVGALLSSPSVKPTSIALPASTVIEASPPAASSEVPTSQVTIEPTATQAAAIGSKENPAPLNTPVTIEGNSVSVVSVLIGADDEVKLANEFNQSPEAGQQYIKIVITSECTADKCNLSPYDFQMVGDKGILYDPTTFVAGVDGMLDDTEYLQGAILSEKTLYFIVDASDTNLRLFFEKLFVFSGPSEAYFLIESQ